MIIDNINLNEDKTANIGEVFFDHKEGVRGVVAANRFVLTVVELSEKNIGILSEEYFQMPNGLGTRWVLQGNKRIDYNISDKIIHFKDYEFEIVSVDKGQVKYIRIK